MNREFTVYNNNCYRFYNFYKRVKNDVECRTPPYPQYVWRVFRGCADNRIARSVHVCTQSPRVEHRPDGKARLIAKVSLIVCTGEVGPGFKSHLVGRKL